MALKTFVGFLVGIPYGGMYSFIVTQIIIMKFIILTTPFFTLYLKCANCISSFPMDPYELLFNNTFDRARNWEQATYLIIQ